VDLYETKSRVAQAFVESIFRRARYRVSAYEDVHTPLRIGHEDFSPTFAAVNGNRPSVLLGVKYRVSIEQFLSLESQRRTASIFVLARRQWPALHFVLVTEHPEPGRSCFQAVPPPRNGGPVTAVDLASLDQFEIFSENVEEHEHLLRSVFALLTRS
jgi:hypothetical protein